jgi:hypothetical protein
VPLQRTCSSSVLKPSTCCRLGGCCCSSACSAAAELAAVDCPPAVSAASRPMGVSRSVWCCWGSRCSWCESSPRLLVAPAARRQHSDAQKSQTRHWPQRKQAVPRQGTRLAAAMLTGASTACFQSGLQLLVSPASAASWLLCSISTASALAGLPPPPPLKPCCAQCARCCSSALATVSTAPAGACWPFKQQRSKASTPDTSVGA